MTQSSENQMRLVSVKNVSGEVIPAYALLLVNPGDDTDAISTRTIEVTKYTAAAAALLATPVLAFNSRLRIGIGSRGMAYMGAGSPVYVRWEDGVSGFDVTQEVGPADGEFYAVAGSDGLIPVAQPDEDNSRLLVVPKSGGSSLVPFMLLTDMRNTPDPLYETEFPIKHISDITGTSAELTPARRRFFSCYAVKLAYTEKYTYVVRFTDDAPTSMIWCVGYGGTRTTDMFNQASGSLAAPSATTLHDKMELLTNWTNKVEVFGYNETYGTDSILFARKQWLIRFDDTVPHARYTGVNASGNLTTEVDAGYVSPFFTVRSPPPNSVPPKIIWWRDYYYPTDTVVKLWCGTPAQEQLKSGAMVYAQKTPGRGYVSLTGECWTFSPS